MKKVVFILMTICCLFSTMEGKAFANEKKQYFAKIQSTGAKFCSSPSENSALFEIPYSYFVKVESVVDDYFAITYKDKVGYVKKDKAKLMNGSPITPYVKAEYQIYLPFSLYQSPTKNSTELVELSEQTQLEYYGLISGQQLSSKSNEWIYSSITQNGEKIFGYVYTGLVDIMPTININTETFDTLSDSVFNDSPSSEFSQLSSGTKILLIISISVPSVLILYFLIKPSKIMQITKSRKQAKKESHKIRHGDYFEFDESQL